MPIELGQAWVIDVLMFITTNDNGLLGYEILKKLMVMDHYQRANGSVSSWYNNGTKMFCLT